MNLSSRVFKYLLLGTSALTLPTGLMAQELPTGGQVAAGGASITHTSPHALTINQSTGSAIINWQSFSVGKGNRVDIVQPDASSALLNRVTGNAPSTIAGAINANGQVYLVNPNGITISSTGQVSAAGFAASTLNIGDDDFMAGRRTFTGNGASGHVANHGTIRTVGRGGYAALIGGTVENSGLIAAPMGKIALGSGEQATLDFAGDGFLQVAIPTKAKGKDALVKQSGKLSANGGMVVMSAAAAKEAARQAVNMSGIVEARGISSRGGVIRLSGGNGKVAVSGKMNTSGKKGGNITVTGRQIALQGAQIDASGANGGGKVRIGGDREGKGTLQRAQGVTIDAATVIAADALTHGNGGDVVVWSDGTTRFAGTLSAKGGAVAGNGGEVEVSGKAVLDYTGQTILTAANGRFGTLLLDPYNVTISTGADSGTAGSTPSSVINVTTLQNQLALANVVIATGSAGDGGGESGTITVANGLTWSSGTTLTLNAVNAIAINAPIRIGGGGGLVLNYDGSSLQNLALGTSGKITYTAQGGSLAINSDSYSLLYSMADIQAINTTGIAGRYALAHDIDAADTLYTASLVSNFDGVFNGLGNSISNLTIHANSQTHVGMFSFVHNQGIIRDLHLKGGEFLNAHSTSYGSLYAGSFAGHNYGTLGNVSSTAAVKILSGSAGYSYAGGLVGYNSGRIERSSAGGEVVATATSHSYAYAGGLIGANFGQVSGSYATGVVRTPDLYSYARTGGLVGDNYGTISQSYALGAVVSNSNYESLVGGLVGRNDGNVTQSYAAGAVLTSGAGYSIGGFIGQNTYYFGFTDNYWNTETTGRAHGLGHDLYGNGGVTGLTTAQLQGALPSGFDASIWGTGAGLYPYLNSFFTNGVKAFSGTARRDGVALVSTVSGIHSLGFGADGKLLGSASTGVNGYYYIAVDAGALPANTQYLAYSTTANSAFYQPTTTGNIGDIDFKANTFIVNTELDRLSAVYNQVESILATDAAGRGMIQGLSGLELSSQSSDFLIDRSVTIKGAHGFVLNAADYALGDDATVTFVADDGTPLTTSAGGSLTINGQNYALLYSMTDIQGINAAGLSGRYAMARDIDAAGATYTQAIVGSEGAHFNGTFTGLGHTLSNLTLDTANLRYVGMFAFANTASIIRDIHLANGSVTANHSSSYIHAGGLVGENQGRILSASFEGGVSAIQTGGYSYDVAYAGGLVGYNQTGQIENSRAAGEVSASGATYNAIAGGLSGYSYNGTITGSRATADVNASVGNTAYYYYSSNIYAGGLVGSNNYTSITSSSASGAVIASGTSSNIYNAYAGGLVGYNSNGVISNTSASGTVHAENADYSHAGGLIGYNYGSISQSYATGKVSASATSSYYTYVGGLVGMHYGQITESYATGNVHAPDQYSYARIGGLVGDNLGEITQSFASGAVVSSSLYENLSGGFIGRNNSSASISENYAMGALIVSGNTNSVGGFIGQGNYYNSNTNNNYWNVQTTGRANGFGYSYYTQAGVTGLMTAQLQGALPIGFDSTVWGTGAGLNPYLKSFFPDGLTAISGMVKLDGTAWGSTAVNGVQTLSMLLDGHQSAMVTLGADGSYYYAFVGQPTANAGFMAHSSAANAVSYQHVTNPAATNFDLTSNALHVKASQDTWSAVEADVQTFLNNNTSMQPVVSGLYGLSLDYAGSFTVDTAVIRSGNIVFTATGDLSLGASGTVSSSNGNVVLSAADNFINNRGADAVSAHGRWLVYSQNASDAEFGGLDSGNTAVWNTAAGGNVSATGNRYVFAARPTLTVNAANATKTYGDTINLGSYYTVTGLSEGVEDAFLGDTESGVLSGSFSLTSAGSSVNANAGDYTLALGMGTATSSGYQIVLGNSSTLTVTPRVLSVAANSASRSYGNANPALTYIINGLVYGDSLSGALATNATILSNVGSYGITQGTLDAGSNYAISFTGNQLSVTPRALNVVANSVSRTYGNANPALTYIAAGLVNGDTLSGALATNATMLSNVGSYGITQGTLDAGSNYAISFTGNQLSVTQRALVVNAHAQMRFYGFANPPLTYSAFGLVNGDALTGELATAADSTSPIGRYSITQGSLAASGNYDLSFNGAELTVAPVQAGITASMVTGSIVPSDSSPSSVTVYNAAWQSFSLEGFVAGELFTDPRLEAPVVCLSNGQCVQVTAE